jgi:hypothetical protein
LLASDPVVLAGGAGALLLVYFLAPPLFSTVAYAARGYKGKALCFQDFNLDNLYLPNLVKIFLKVSKNPEYSMFWDIMTLQVI